MKYKCVIFDLDGTLLDTLGDLAAAVNAALQKRNCAPRTLDEVRRFVGNGVKNLITRALPNGASPAEIEDTLADFKAYYNAHLNAHTAPYAGILPLLERLRKAGVKVAVNSNKYDAALQFLCREHFAGLYDAALGETPEIPKKPSPEAAQRLVAQLDCSLAETAYVGDSGVDIQTARNAGVDSISVSWGFRTREELAEDHPQIIFDDADSLAEYLLR